MAGGGRCVGSMRAWRKGVATTATRRCGPHEQLWDSLSEVKPAYRKIVLIAKLMRAVHIKCEIFYHQGVELGCVGANITGFTYEPRRTLNVLNDPHRRCTYVRRMHPMKFDVARPLAWHHNLFLANIGPIQST